jgi:hypothetical protein
LYWARRKRLSFVRVEGRGVSAFREHFLEKYFSYRARYVDYVVANAPQRGALANLSEIVRLAFVCTGSLLIAGILWLATVLSSGTHPIGAAFSGMAALAATLAVAGSAKGIGVALRDRRRVEERAAAAANVPSP